MAYQKPTIPDEWPDDDLSAFAEELLAEWRDDDGTMFGGAEIAEMQHTGAVLGLEHKRRRTPPRVHELAAEHGLVGETSHPDDGRAVIIFEGGS